MRRGMLVDREARYRGHHLALVCGSERLTWRHLGARGSRLANARWDPDIARAVGRRTPSSNPTGRWLRHCAARTGEEAHRGASSAGAAAANGTRFPSLLFQGGLRAQ